MINTEDWKWVGVTNAYPDDTTVSAAARWVSATFPGKARHVKWNKHQDAFRFSGGQYLHRIEIDQVGEHGWPQWKIYRRIECNRLIGNLLS